MKTPTTSQWTLDTTFQMCLFRCASSDVPLQIRTWSLGTFFQRKQQCHNDHQGQLEHPVHRRGCANDQPRRYHQVPVEFHLPGRTRLHLFCDKVKLPQPQEQCANCNRLNSSWRFPQQNPIMREGERIWVKPWHCEEATGWGRWLLQVQFWFEDQSQERFKDDWMICHLLLLYLSLSMIWYYLWNVKSFFLQFNGVFRVQWHIPGYHHIPTQLTLRNPLSSPFQVPATV